ncbi:Jacalin-like lectin domain [Arabidopsis suecica]|uniref:Jacalin-like lectin domain n=1 Tax=Arabidopsis suecica TaxID=45249 RepID=A0A8T1ZDK8_ARASU|nr:Jacalin-like lectin domain [Arabidopsis suecica]
MEAMSSEKMGPVGGDTGGAFNDGVFDGVKKITVVTDGTDIDCVSYIKIEYVKDDKIETRVHGTIVGGLAFQLNEFEPLSADQITNLQNLLWIGRTSPILGEANSSGSPNDKEFMFEGKNGEKLLGFHGRSGEAIDAIGVYFGTASGGGGSQKLELRIGEGCGNGGT